MAKIAKTFSLSEEAVELISQYMVENNLSTLSSALEGILKEYQILSESIKNNLGIDAELKKIKYDTSDTLKKVMVLYEMLNNMLIIQNVDSFISSDMLKNISVEKAEKCVEDYMHQRNMTKRR